MGTGFQCIIDLLAQWARERKVGSIQVNFFKGGITTVNLNETVKLNENQLPKGKDT